MEAWEAIEHFDNGGDERRVPYPRKEVILDPHRVKRSGAGVNQIEELVHFPETPDAPCGAGKHDVKSFVANNS